MLTPHENRSRHPLSNIHVLVVDDDRAIAGLIKDVLKNLGFGHVQLEFNALDGLRTIKTQPIDLVITDWEMADVSGIELTKKIRELDPPKSFLPVIMLSGHGERSKIEHARDSGITEYVIKPFTAKTLCSRIMMVVDSPRSFIIAKTYKGPSRRRRSQEPPDGSEKRKRRKKPS